MAEMYAGFFSFFTEAQAHANSSEKGIQDEIICRQKHTLVLQFQLY